MKKVLLATTILGMTAGFASAEIAFTGEGTAGFASVDGGDYDNYTSLNLGVTMSGESDSGLSFGAEMALTAGETFDFDEDDSSIDSEDGYFGDDPKVWISGGFGKLAFSQDGFDNYSDDAFENNDLEYTHSVAGIDIGIRTSIESSDNSSSIKLGYTVAGVKLGLVYDEENSATPEDYSVSASYSFGAITAGVAVDEADVTTLSLNYDANGITAGVEVESDDDYTLTAGYKANGLSFGAETNQDEDMEVTAGYDLGGGLSLEAGYYQSGLTTDDATFFGAKMKF